MGDSNKQTSAPLPGAKTAKQRGDALRQNLARRKQQTRARNSRDKSACDSRNNKSKE